MKKLLFAGLFLFAFTAFGQQIKFGVKGGAVFNADKGLLKTTDALYKNKGKGSTGFQAGAMVRIKAAGFYVQPEMLYTQYKNEYKEETGQSFDLTKKRLDFPVNVGKTFGLGLVQIQTGPVFSYYFKDGNSLKGITHATRDEFNVGWQFGTGLNLRSLLIDVRYEFGFGKTTSKWTGFEAKSRPQLIHLSLGYFF